jgi:hypothetical protein
MTFAASFIVHSLLTTTILTIHLTCLFQHSLKQSNPLFFSVTRLFLTIVNYSFIDFISTPSIFKCYYLQSYFANHDAKLNHSSTSSNTNSSWNQISNRYSVLAFLLVFVSTCPSLFVLVVLLSLPHLESSLYLLFILMLVYKEFRGMLFLMKKHLLFQDLLIFCLLSDFIDLSQIYSIVV